ncbi:MAG: hypothetical protein ABL997_08150 [Planctomycetota bacterium]
MVKKRKRLVPVELSAARASSGPFCPACGTSAFPQNGSRPCSHLVYALIDEAGEFAYVREDLAAVLDPELESETAIADWEARSSWDLLELLQVQLDAERTLAFSVKSSGMACGKAPTTVHVAFDLAASGS